MAIYDTVPRLDDVDKRLLRLIAELLLQQTLNRPAGDNYPDAATALSDAEAAELLGLLERLLGNREFQEKMVFVEDMAAKRTSDATAREIFLTGRRRAGKSRALASAQWGNFQVRLGIIRRPLGYGINARPMDFDYFLKMENRLLKSLGIHARVLSLILALVASVRTEVDAIRFEEKATRLDIVKGLLRPLLNRMKTGEHLHVNYREVSKYDLAAAFTLISNAAVMFTTRDWGVAGTISTMAGALIGVRKH